MSQLPSKNRALGLLFLAVFIDLFGFGMILPILPGLATKLGASNLVYGLLIASYSLMQFLFSSVWGWISDRVGRRPIILIGLGGSSIGFGFLGIATQLSGIFLARIIAGIFTSATLTTANAYITDITPPAERASAFRLITAAFGLGFAIGPGIGALVSHIVPIGPTTISSPSFLASIMSIINLIGAIYFIDESLKPENRKLNAVGKLHIPRLGYLGKYGNAPLYVAIFSLVTFAFSNYITSFPLFAMFYDPSVDAIKLGYYFTYAGLVLFFSQFLLVNFLVNWMGERRVVIISMFLIFLGFSILPFVYVFEWMLIPSTLLILGISLVNPSLNSMISKDVPQNEQGTVMGINQSLASLMRAIGPIIAGITMLITDSTRSPFLIGSIVILMALIYYSVKGNRDV